MEKERIHNPNQNFEDFAEQLDVLLEKFERRFADLIRLKEILNFMIFSFNENVNIDGCCMKGILETGGVMGQCVQMWTRNYGALDQTARVCFGVLCANRKKEGVKGDFGPANKERGACCEHTPGV
ncbi:hypothetical protein TNCV_3706231 [Trichonephila clavipes]|nr:hypothetical protein TNCV_3706231 [Trichonephila clavipes]